jgi:glycogen debranching enzyme
VRESGDEKFAKTYFEKANSAVQWLSSKDRDNDFLIEERVFANWADSVLKFGRVLYTNCCYHKALADFSWLCTLTGNEKLLPQYERLVAKTKEKINGFFWEGNYYADWYDWTRHDFFASDGNVLAIVWGIADDEQAQMIETKIRQHRLNAVPLKTNYPAYPFWRIPIMFLPFQAYHYHNGFSWPWLGCLNTIALNKIGWKKEARQELRKLAQMINENGTVHEVFDERGKPVRTLLLKSESPFAWSAGTFIRAVHEMRKSGSDSGKDD